MNWPFDWTLKGILLTGKERELAKAKYELQGEELERELLKLLSNTSTKEYKREVLELDRKYKKVTDLEYSRQLLELDKDNFNEKDYKIKSLELDLKEHKISELEFEKQVCTIKGEPWVKYRDYGLDDSKGNLGFWFELDWNSVFVEALKKEGYKGVNEEEIVRKWYAELCRVIALEEGLAMDLFGDLEPPSIGAKRRVIRDNVTEYR